MFLKNIWAILSEEFNLRGKFLIAWLLWGLLTVIICDVSLFNPTIFLSIFLFGPLVTLCLWMISYLEHQRVLQAQRGMTD